MVDKQHTAWRMLVVSLGFAGILVHAQSGPQKAQMIEAARMDAYTQLARQIKGLQVSNHSAVANHVTTQAVTKAITKALVQGARIGEPEFIGDNICMVPAELTIQQVIQNIERLKKHNGLFKTVDVTNIKEHTNYKTLTAQGTGTLPAPKVGGKRGKTIDDKGLKQALEKLEGPGQSKLGAKEAAYLDACAQLARQIKGIHIDDESIVLNMAKKSRWTEGATNMLVKGAQIKAWKAIDKDVIACVTQITYEQVVENVERVRKYFAGVKTFDKMTIQQDIGGYRTVTATGYGGVGRGRVDNPTINFR